MVKLLNIVGARPQIIKASAIHRKIRSEYKNLITEIMVHTGQHYDKMMSGTFFDELTLPDPHYNIMAGSASHSVQTARMLEGLEEIILKEEPDAVIVYGDTNSTLAAALTASKLNIPVIHIEAGLRSYNKTMPEEINRIVCDHLSTLLFTPTIQGMNNLIKEGFSTGQAPPYTPDNPGVHHCGDIMLDNALHFSQIPQNRGTLIDDLGLDGNEYILVTLHRDSNTDIPERLERYVQSFIEISAEKKMHIIWPMHPRTSGMIESKSSPQLQRMISESKWMRIVPPVSYLDMLRLEKGATLILTDSGGVQKEAHFFHKPCLILRPETEWTELTENGTARIIDCDPEKLVEGVNHYLSADQLDYPEYYGDGNAAGFICNEILKWFNSEKVAS